MAECIAQLVEYRYQDASEWVRTNVIKPLFYSVGCISPDFVAEWDFQYIFGKRNIDIAGDILQFIWECEGGSFGNDFIMNKIKFYGYYADYDWVLFCSLFGRMVDLPEGFPMYCNDLKQIFEDRNLGDGVYWLDGGTATLDQVKGHCQYPENLNEHSAIDDALWNKRLHQFILDHMDPIPECL